MKRDFNVSSEVLRFKLHKTVVESTNSRGQVDPSIKHPFEIFLLNDDRVAVVNAVERVTATDDSTLETIVVGAIETAKIGSTISTITELLTIEYPSASTDN